MHIICIISSSSLNLTMSGGQQGLIIKLLVYFQLGKDTWIDLKHFWGYKSKIYLTHLQKAEFSPSVWYSKL